MKHFNISQRGSSCPASPIRKLVPYAEQAKKAGVKVYHLNIGQPDIESPAKYLLGLKTFPEKIVAYENSLGNLKLRQALVEYYQKLGIKAGVEEIIVTSGGSEAILFSFLAVMDPGDNCLVTEPFYANYAGFAAMAGIKLKPVTTKAETGFHLPNIKEIEQLIDERTRAIIICNPNNPTGTVYSKEELMMIVRLAQKYKLLILADETYREFVYDRVKHWSCLKLGKKPQNVILVDSFSKRYSLCGARLGCLVSFNKKVLETVTKFCQARLAVGTVSQQAAIKILRDSNGYLNKAVREYQKRRNVVIKALQQIPGVMVKTPEGAFYAVVKLPVKNTEDFCRWLLTDFRYQQATVMLAPAAGFYLSKLGKDEVRVAYVINSQDLERAMVILKQALEKYKKK